MVKKASKRKASLTLEDHLFRHKTEKPIKKLFIGVFWLLARTRGGSGCRPHERGPSRSGWSGRKRGNKISKITPMMKETIPILISSWMKSWIIAARFLVLLKKNWAEEQYRRYSKVGLAPKCELGKCKAQKLASSWKKIFSSNYTERTFKK